MEQRWKASTVTFLDGGDCSDAKANNVHLSINDPRLIVLEALLVRKMSLESRRLAPRFWWVGILLNKGGQSRICVNVTNSHIFLQLSSFVISKDSCTAKFNLACYL